MKNIAAILLTFILASAAQKINAQTLFPENNNTTLVGGGPC